MNKQRLLPRCLFKHFKAACNYLFSQLWFPTVQEVLHADWQEVWHSPQPPFFTVFCKLFVFGKWSLYDELVYLYVNES